MASAPAADLASVRVKLDLPANVLADYERQAADQHKPLEDVLAARLAQAVHWTAERPIYLSDVHRTEIEVILKRNINSPRHLVDAIRMAVSLRIDGAKIAFAPDLLRRLQGRHLDHSLSWTEYLTKLTTRLLEQHVGLR